jgi:hypothetical protein
MLSATNPRIQQGSDGRLGELARLFDRVTLALRAGPRAAWRSSIAVANASATEVADFAHETAHEMLTRRSRRRRDGSTVPNTSREETPDQTLWRHQATVAITTLCDLNLSGRKAVRVRLPPRAPDLAGILRLRPRHRAHRQPNRTALPRTTAQSGRRPDVDSGADEKLDRRSTRSSSD